jgi:ABC-2 type transport system ATP-binding protein
MTDTTAIRTENLTKAFGQNVAVDSVNIEVQKGELFGLVGPDGAGKTTMMRLLTAIMEPTSGKAWIAGHSVIDSRDEIGNRIGYMSQRFGLYEDLTVMENILFYADLYGVPSRERPPRIERLLGFSNLAPFQERLAGKLSGGMKQKLGLACALIHTPEVLFLDEPTCGVDPVSRRDFWKLLYRILAEGITIFISTSYLDEAERCTRVALIHEGRLLLVDTPSAVKKMLTVPMWELSTPRARSAGPLVGALPGVRSVNMYGDRLHVALQEGYPVDDIVSGMQKAGMEIEGLREITPSLEDVFIWMVQGKTVKGE